MRQKAAQVMASCPWLLGLLVLHTVARALRGSLSEKPMMFFTPLLLLGANCRAADVEKTAKVCPNMAGNIDRSANGQCAALTQTLSMSGASGGVEIIFPARSGEQHWHNAFYVSIPKCGSSTFVRFGGVRLDTSGARPFMGFRPYPKARTSFFTIVRDPLQRFISAYYELHHRKAFSCSLLGGRCWASVGESPLALTHLPEKATILNLAQVLERLEALVKWIEQDGFFDAHLALQVYYLQKQRPAAQRETSPTKLPRGYHFLADDEIVPLDHVYDLHCLDEAVMATNITTRRSTNDPTTHHTFNMHEHTAYTQHVGGAPLALNSSMLPPPLARRVCELYEADYCCLGLAMSPECEGFVPGCGAGAGPCAMRGSVKALLWHHRKLCERNVRLVYHDYICVHCTFFATV